MYTKVNVGYKAEVFINWPVSTASNQWPLFDILAFLAGDNLIFRFCVAVLMVPNFVSFKWLYKMDPSLQKRLHASLYFYSNLTIFWIEFCNAIGLDMLYPIWDFKTMMFNFWLKCYHVKMIKNPFINNYKYY